MRKGFNEMIKKKSLNLDPPKDLPKPTKKQQETEESAKKRREEFNKEKEELLKRKEQDKAREEEEKKRFDEKKAREDEENRKKALEGKEKIREMDEKYLEQKKKMLESVGNRPKMASTISSEYSKTNSQPRTLTLIKQKMLSRGILPENIIGESDNFINIIAEDLV
jgi:ParB-like chromosome segregation protein Spo0J